MLQGVFGGFFKGVQSSLFIYFSRSGLIFHLFHFSFSSFSGIIEVNGKSTASGAPFGGYKHSGIGRENGELGLKEFIEVKVVSDWS